MSGVDIVSPMRSVRSFVAGEEITINGLISKKGTTYGIVGQLSEQEYNGRKVCRF